MRSRTLAGMAGLAAAATLVATTGVAFAHHAVFSFDADGAAVPGGDPDGTAVGTVDFESEVSPEVCIDATVQDLGTITGVRIVNTASGTMLLDFGADLENCVVATDEEREALHDGADLYRVLILTEEFPEGAVAGVLAEVPPSTTTSITTTTTSRASTSTVPATVAPTVTANPRFTG